MPDHIDSRTDRAIRTLLRFMPRWLRETDGESLMQSYRDVIDNERQAGRSPVRTWAWLVLDAAGTGLRARLAGTAGRGRSTIGTEAGRSARLHVGADIRWATRSLRRTPMWTGVAILLLGLGIGSNVAIFRLVQPVLISPLPYPEPASLVWVVERQQPSGQTGAVSRPAFWDYRNASAISALAAMSGTSVNLTGLGEALRIEGWQVSPGYFELVGARPVLGRTFVPEDEMPGRPPVVIVSHGLWQTALGGDPAAPGRTLTLDGQTATVVGVMPPRYQDLGSLLVPDSGADFWMPLEIDPGAFNTRSASLHGLRVVGRLAPGRVPADASRELTAALDRLSDRYGLGDPGSREVVVTGLADQVATAVTPALRALTLAVGCLLLLACVNVTSLLVARSETRAGELRVRAALGASRMRLVRLTIFEALGVSLAGGLLGIGLALATGGALNALMPPTLPPAGSIDTVVVIFTLSLALGSGLLAGLIPAVRVFRLHRAGRWSDGGGRGSVTGAQSRIWRGLLVVQIASAVALVCGAGLMLRTMSSLGAIDLGFDPSGLQMVTVNASRSTYDSPQRVRDLYDAIAFRLRATPGIDASAVAWQTPLQTQMSDWPVMAEGEGREWLSADPNLVSPGYFDAMSISVVAGRTFDRGDQLRTDGGVILNETAARQLWPDGQAVGQRVNMDFSGAVWREVIGVVADVRGRGVALEPRPQWYMTFGGGPLQGLTSLTLVVRTSMPAADLRRTLSGVLADIAPDVPLSDLRSMTQQVSGTLALTRMITAMTTAMGAMALLLAAVGVYGLMTFMIQSRRRELGLRLALGASPGTVTRLVIGRAAGLGIPGVVLGLAGAVVGGRLLSGFLHGVSATDVPTLTLVALVVLAAIGLAALAPARKAARIDPLRALASMGDG